MTISNLGRKGLFAYTPTHSPLSKQLRVRTQAGQEPKQRPWRGAAHWLALHGWLSLLPYSIQDYQLSDGTTTTVDWVFPHN